MLIAMEMSRDVHPAPVARSQLGLTDKATGGVVDAGAAAAGASVMNSGGPVYKPELKLLGDAAVATGSCAAATGADVEGGASGRDRVSPESRVSNRPCRDTQQARLGQPESVAGGGAAEHDARDQGKGPGGVGRRNVSQPGGDAVEQDARKRGAPQPCADVVGGERRERQHRVERRRVEPVDLRRARVDGVRASFARRGGLLESLCGLRGFLCAQRTRIAACCSRRTAGDLETSQNSKLNRRGRQQPQNPGRPAEAS